VGFRSRSFSSHIPYDRPCHPFHLYCLPIAQLGIDYTPLKEHLAACEFEKADDFTRAILITIVSSPLSPDQNNHILRTYPLVP